MRTRVLSSISIFREVGRLIWAEADGFVKLRFGAAVLLVSVTSVITALGPVLLKGIVDRLAGTVRDGELPLLFWAAAYVLVQWIGRAVVEGRGLILARAERRTARRLSERLFAHILRLPLKYHLGRQTGALMQSLATGLQGYQNIVQTLAFSVLPIFTELGTTIVVLSRLGKPLFLWLFAGAVVCYAIVFGYSAYRTMMAARNASAAQAEAMATIADSVLNYETIKHFTAEPVVESKVGGALIRAEQQWIGFSRQYAANGLLVATIYMAFLGTTILYAIGAVRSSAISIGTFVLINTYMLQILRPIEQLGYAAQSLSQSVAYLDKMLELLREQTEVEEGASPAAEGASENVGSIAPLTFRKRENSAELGAEGEGVRGPTHCQGSDEAPAELEFRDVFFSYGKDRPVLRGVTFSVGSGKTLGIVGASGSGKSTIVRLIVRLLEPDGGAILLDGTPVRWLPLARLRKLISVVPQDTALFNESIRFNISVGRPGSSYDDIQRSAKMAHLHDFVLSLPDQYETVVGERGVQLSGGEKQRVSIARAVLKQPRLYIADESTSSLDSRTEREIVKNLQEVSRNTTTLIIAHRLSTIVHADEIIVLDGGVVVESGTHEYLLAINGRYSALWAAQHQGLVAA